MNDLSLLSPQKVLWEREIQPETSRKDLKSDSENPHFFRAFQDNLTNICKIDLLHHTLETLQIDHSSAIQICWP